MSASAVNAEFKAEILSALNDDLNSSLALAGLDNFINQANEYLDKNLENRESIPELFSNFDYYSNLNCSFLGIQSNKNLVDDYKNGKNVFGFIVGLIMKNTNGKANPVVTSKVLQEELNKL